MNIPMTTKAAKERAAYLIRSIAVPCIRPARITARTKAKNRTSWKCEGIFSLRASAVAPARAISLFPADGDFARVNDAKKIRDAGCCK